MVFDYAPNGDFSSYLKLNSKSSFNLINLEILNLEQAKFYIAQIVNVLAYMHSKGIVHRDLKPGNFLFSETWHLILADFGTAKELKKVGNMSPMACGESGKNGTFNSFSSTLTRQSSANTLLKSNASMSGASSNARDENDVDDLFTSKPNFEEEP